MCARTTRVVTVVVGLMGWSLLGGNAFAQSKTATTIGPFLMIEPSARIAAMGNAGVATYGEVQAAYYNPGAIGQLAQTQVQFTYSPWLAGITYNYAAAAVRLDDTNVLLLTVTSLNSGEIIVRTEEQPHGTGERYTVQDLAFGLGYSRRFTDHFSAGLQVKYLRERIWHSSMQAAAIDFGVLYQLPFRAYLGASVSNFGTRGVFDGRDLSIRHDAEPDEYGDNSSLPAALETEDFPLPIHFRVGIAWPVSFGDDIEARFVLNAMQPSDANNDINFGGEWTLMDILSLRAGFQSLRKLLTDLDLADDDAEMGLTLGGGLRYSLSGLGLRFDYAWAGHDHLGSMQRFTVGVAF